MAELMEAYKNQTAVRALQRLMNGRNLSKPDIDSIKLGCNVLFYYKSSKQNEVDEWKSGTVEKLSQKVMENRKPGIESDSKVARENIIHRPKSDFERELSEGVREGFIDLTPRSTSAVQPNQKNGICENLFGSAAVDIDSICKDIGDLAETLFNNEGLQTPTYLESSEQKILEEISKTIG